MKVLIVDDNEDNRVLHETVLTSHGYTVESANNGVQALEVAARFLPDIIISDILMPEMDGYELCRAVKKDERLRNIPFVFYTSSYTGPKDKELATALGASRYIVKPMEMEEFLKEIKEILEEHKDGTLSMPVPSGLSDEELVQMHGETLIRKLSDKVRELKAENTRRKMAENTILRRNRTLKVLSECNKSLISAEEEHLFLTGLCKMVVEVAGYKMAWVGFAEMDDKKKVRVVAKFGFEDEYLESIKTTWSDDESGQGPTGTAIRTLKPSICRNTHTAPEFAPWRDEAVKRGYKSSVAIPLLEGEVSIGALNIYSVEADAFDKEEVELLRKVADSIVSGIKTIRLRVEKRKTEENLLQKTGLIKLQQEITLTANEAPSHEEAMQICINKICTYSGWPVGHVYMLDSAGKLLPTTIWYTSNPNKFKEFRKVTEETTFSIGEGLPGRVLRDARPHWIIDVTKDPGFLRTKLIQQINVRGAFAFPVLEKERVVAVLEFFSEEVSGPDVLMLDTITQLATQLGRVTERKRAEYLLKIRASQQREISEIGKFALTSETELTELMDRIVSCVAKTLDVEYCKVLELLPDDKKLLLRAGVGWKEGHVGTATVGAEKESQAGYTLLSASPVIVYDLKTETRFNGPALLHDHGVVSGISTIIYGRDVNVPYGVLGAHTKKKLVFTKDDANFVQSIANILSEAIKRKQDEALIKASLREKELLIGEIYHRTRNNMSVICSLLGMQSNYTKDEHLLKIFKEMDNRIRSMSLVHSKLYQAKDLSSINLKDYIADLVSNLFRSYQVTPDKISLKFIADDVSLAIDHAIPCGLAINEIITNSLKHAFSFDSTQDRPASRKGEIKINLRSTDKGEIELKIADNGIGMPKGFDIKNTDTLGLKLVFGLLEQQLDGKIEINCENGVEFLITFKGRGYTKRI